MITLRSKFARLPKNAHSDQRALAKVYDATHAQLIAERYAKPEAKTEPRTPNRQAQRRAEYRAGAGA